MPGALSDAAAPLYPRTLTECIGPLIGTGSFGALAPSSLLRPGIDIGPATAALAQLDDPEDLRIRTPVRVQQGTADNTVFKVFTDPLVADYRKRGNPVTYLTYEGVDHGGIVTNAKSADRRHEVHPQAPALTGRTYAEARGFERAVRRFASSGPGSWLFTRVAHHLDRVVYRATKGKHLASESGRGLPVAFVTTTGARSGVRRTVPLVALPTEDGLAIFGSWYGNRRHPAWRHNLRANPEGEVEVRGERWTFPRRGGRGRAARADLERGAAHLPGLRHLREARRPAPDLRLHPPSGLGPSPDAAGAPAAYG